MGLRRLALAGGLGAAIFLGSTRIGSEGGSVSGGAFIGCSTAESGSTVNSLVRGMGVDPNNVDVRVDYWGDGNFGPLVDANQAGGLISNDGPKGLDSKSLG